MNMAEAALNTQNNIPPTIAVSTTRMPLTCGHLLYQVQLTINIKDNLKLLLSPANQVNVYIPLPPL